MRMMILGIAHILAKVADAYAHTLFTYILGVSDHRILLIFLIDTKFLVFKKMPPKNPLENT